MEDETFEKIQELIKAISALHPVVAGDNEKQMRVYMAMHELKTEVEKLTGITIKFK